MIHHTSPRPMSFLSSSSSKYSYYRAPLHFPSQRIPVLPWTLKKVMRIEDPEELDQLHHMLSRMNNTNLYSHCHVVLGMQPGHVPLNCPKLARGIANVGVMARVRMCTPGEKGKTPDDNDTLLEIFPLNRVELVSINDNMTSALVKDMQDDMGDDLLERAAFLLSTGIQLTQAEALAMILTRKGQERMEWILRKRIGRHHPT